MNLRKFLQIWIIFMSKYLYLFLIMDDNTVARLRHRVSHNGNKPLKENFKSNTKSKQWRTINTSNSAASARAGLTSMQ